MIRLSTANAAVPAGFVGLPSAERFIGNLEINRTLLHDRIWREQKTERINHVLR
jgi:hypothetical protein